MAANFDYNQLNIVGRDKSSIKFIQDALINELDHLKSRVDVNGENFKNIVTIANQVWAGPDKDAFIKNLTTNAQNYVNEINTVKANIQKYLTNDVNDFENLQRRTTSITSK